MYREKNEIGHKKDHTMQFAENTYVRTWKSPRQMQREYQAKLNRKARMEKCLLNTDSEHQRESYRRIIREIDQELKHLDRQMKTCIGKRNRIKSRPKKKNLDTLEEQVLPTIAKTDKTDIMIIDTPNRFLQP